MIIHNPQICYKILYFLAVIESQTGKNFIWYCVFHKRILYCTRLSICSVKNGAVTVMSRFFISALHLIGYELCLVFFSKTSIRYNRITITAVRPQLLAHTFFIISYNSICSIQYCGCRTIVLLKHYTLGILIILFKFQNIIYIRAPEFIYTLVIITNNAYIPVPCCKYSYQFVLCIVRILIFINKYVLKTCLIFFSHILIILKNINSKQYNIIKIKRVITDEPALIKTIDISNCS